MVETNICKQCQVNFEIPQRDMAFYERIKVPRPTLCPDCRQQRRLAWRNERTLYRRTCDLTGESVISNYAPGSQYKVYAPSSWWGDRWDPKTYGRPYDFNKPFFEQFAQLQRQVPLLAVYNTDGQNSDFNHSVSWLKNCYMLAGANKNEECYYGNYINYCTSCVDNIMIKKCELCYECVECENCYQSAFLKNCSNCTSSYFLFNCIGCTDCFGCVNLRRKQYYFLNQQFSKEEYFQKLKELNMGKYSSVVKAREFFQQHLAKFPMKYMIGEHNENSSGNSVFHCKNTFSSFDVAHLEDCSYCSWFNEARDCYDCFAWGMPAELCYECMEVGDHAYNNKFCVSSQGLRNAEYCFQCMYSENLFGCVSIKKGSYCILNKQYRQEEYEALVPKIKEHMKKTGESGELFPMALSPFAYNETVAQEYFPISKEDALAKGYRWKDPDQKEYSSQTYEIPDDIKNVPETVLHEVLACATCTKNYKIIPQELRFYKQVLLPIPRQCPDCRHTGRTKLRNPRHLWNRTCAKCGAEIQTSYAPDRPEIVYCERCYLEAVD